MVENRPWLMRKHVTLIYNVSYPYYSLSIAFWV